MTPYYEEDGITIYHGDCADVLPTIDPASVDLLLTDPPYGMGWEFNGQGSGKGAQGGRGSRFMGKTVKGDAQAFNPTHLLGYSRVIIWGAHHFPQHLHPGSLLVWMKKYPDAFGTFLSDADVAWMNVGRGVYCSPVINPASFQAERVHPTQKPTDLMRWIVDRWTEPGDLILDPYMGSGPIAQACKDLGRRYVGVELVEDYCKAAVGRLSQQVLDFGIRAYEETT